MTKTRIGCKIIYRLERRKTKNYKAGSFMCRCKKKKAPVTVVEAIPVQEPKDYVVNCPKCGAALKIKDGGSFAYMCPVCNTLLRVKTGVKYIKDVDTGDKSMHVAITATAAAYIADLGAQGKSVHLESLIAQQIAGGYSPTDSYVVDLGAYP